MKLYALKFATALATCCACCLGSLAHAGTLNTAVLDALAGSMSRNAANPALKWTANSWYQNTGFNAARVFHPAVIKHDSQYLMYYAGEPHNNHLSIGLATSTDGITFTHASNNPVINYGQQGWSNWRVAPQAVFRDEDTGLFRMYYHGDDRNLYAINGVGMATSTDGIHWTLPNDNPVIGPAGTIPNDRLSGNPPWGPALYEVAKLGNTYHVYYGQPTLTGTYHATSTNGVDFSTDNGVHIEISNDFRVHAAVGHTYQGTDFLIGVLSKNDTNEYVFGVSLDGVNWELGSTALQLGAPGKDGAYRELIASTLIIEDGKLKLFGYRGDGDHTWSYGNYLIETAEGTEPDWAELLGATVIPTPSAAGLGLLGLAAAFGRRRR